MDRKSSPMLVQVTAVHRQSTASDFSSASTCCSESTTSSALQSNFAPSSRPVSASTAASSRPSSVASNGSSSSAHALSPSLLSPSLASALSASRHHALGHSASSSSSSHSHSSGGTASPHIRTAAAGPSVIRRTSLPIVPSMVNRVSVASIASFDSLPEDETVPSFGTSFSSAAAPQASSARPSFSCWTGDAHPNRPAVFPPSPRSASRPLLSQSPPSSPDSQSGGQRPPARLRPSSSLKRSCTEPASPNYELCMEKRKMVAMELLQTEKVFVASLNLINDSYLQPLLRSSGKPGPSAAAASTGTSPILSRKSIGEIFSNFIDILNLNTELLSRLDRRLSGQSRPATTRPNSIASVREADINASSGGSASVEASPVTPLPWDPATDVLGDILVPIAPFLKMYSLYVKNFSSALARIESERKSNVAFAKFLKHTEKAAWGKGSGFGFGLGFQAHLLTVVQRIPRYKLLVGDLVKNTPSSHPDHDDLNKAYQMVEQVASYINENIRQHEMVLVMLSLQRSLTGLTEPLVVPGRSLLKRGTLLKACRKNIQPREFFLFSDCLVYASPVSGGMESASAAWQALARGGLYGNTTELASPTSATSPSVPSDTDSSEMPILAFSQRIRTSSGPTMDQQALTGAAFHLEGQQLQFRGKFPLQDCTVVGVEDSEGLRHSFEIRTPEKSFAVYAETSQGREGWLSAVREARAELMSARRTLRTDEDTIEAKRNRRRSQYQESKSNLRGVSGMSRRTGMSTAPSNGTIAESDSQDGTGPVRSESREIMRPSSSAPTSVSLATLLAPSVNSATPPKALRVLEDYNAPVWVPDSRADRCICCAEGFGIWRRKHHCRLCGQVVCWACSTREFLIASYEEGQEDRPARACDSCYDSVFPSESPQLSPDLLVPPDKPEPMPSSVSGTSAGPNSNSDSTTPIDPASSPGSPITPVEDSPMAPSVSQLDTGENEGEGDDSLTTKVKMEYAPKKSGTDRPRSLRIDSLGPLGSHPNPSMEALLLSQATGGRFDRNPFGLGGGSSAGVFLSNASLHPNVQTATSGSGTFRLVTPRLTTPDAVERSGSNEAEAASPARHAHKIGHGGSYFANAAIPSSGAWADANGANGANGNGTPGAQNGYSYNYGFNQNQGPQRTGARERPRKKPLSAAARLSTFYGNALAATSSSSSTGGNAGANAGGNAGAGAGGTKK